MTVPKILVEGRSLTKTFRRGAEQVNAVQNADLRLDEGELVALVGPSGSGKTTILNLLAGWDVPDAGDIYWAGVAAGAALESLPWHDIAIVPQTLGLLEELTIRENVALPLRLGASDRLAPERVDLLLDDLGLAQLADRSPSEVSLGEQQRAAIARALVGPPRLLLTDEPSGHQDAVWARGVFRELRRACAAGTTCLVATHNEEVLTFVDRILEMHDGAIVSSHAARKEHDAPH